MADQVLVLLTGQKYMGDFHGKSLPEEALFARVTTVDARAWAMGPGPYQQCDRTAARAEAA